MAKSPRLPSDISIRDFVTAVGAVKNVHGTASAAGVAGARGAALVLWVAARPRLGSDSVHDQTILRDAAAALTGIQLQLIETVETETAVRLFAARQLPRASEVERSERQAAIQLALRATADVPLEVVRLCARGITLAETVAVRCERRAAADIRLGVALLHAALNGARANLEAKLTSLTDAEFLTSVVDEIVRLSEQAAMAARAAESAVEVPPA
jgi:formiminotetrahydrofolate cyclodeaminase